MQRITQDRVGLESCRSRIQSSLRKAHKNNDLYKFQLCLELEAGYDDMHESMSVLSSVVQSITENRDAPSTMMRDSDQELTSLFYQV